MKDEELKLKEIEVSHTLGGVGEVVRGQGRGEGVNITLQVVIHTYIHQSHGRSHNHSMSGWVAITDESVYMRDPGVGGRG